MNRIRRFLLAGSTAALVGASMIAAGPGAAHADNPTGVSERTAQVAAAQASDPIAVPTAINTGVTELQLAEAMFADPTIITGASFVAKPPLGTPVAVADSGTPLSGFPKHGSTYGIMSTGNAAFAANANTSTGTSADNGGPNVRGTSDFDVTILKIDFTVPAGPNCLSIAYFKFLSEEFPEYVGSIYNDAFIAELDVSNWTTSGSVITAPNNFAFDPAGKPLSVNAAGATSMTAAEASGTTYDGATPTVVASKTITPGPHSLYLSIFDQGDRVFDSATFVDEIALKATAPGSCVSGAYVPLTTSKTADASVSAAGATNGYTITISNPNTTAVQVDTIYDDLPAGFAYQAGTTTGATIANPSISGQHLTWNGPFSVPPTGSVSLHFHVNVGNTPGTFYNNAGGTSGITINPVTNTAPITVQAGTITKAEPAVLDLNGPATAYLYNLRARLATTAGLPLGGQTMRFYVDGTPVTCLNTGSNAVLTDFTGTATCNALLSAATVTLGFGYEAVFFGTPTHTGSSDSAGLVGVLGTELP